MIATADPHELRRKARECRAQASDVEEACSHLSREVESILQVWKGIAAESFREATYGQILQAQRAANQLRDAADGFELGAIQVEMLRAKQRV